MNEDLFNLQVRKFLKNVGVTSQREIENAIRSALDSGQITEKSIIKANIRLTIDDLNLAKDIDGTIQLSWKHSLVVFIVAVEKSTNICFDLKQSVSRVSKKHI